MSRGYTIVRNGCRAVESRPHMSRVGAFFGASEPRTCEKPGCPAVSAIGESMKSNPRLCRPLTLPTVALVLLLLTTSVPTRGNQSQATNPVRAPTDDKVFRPPPPFLWQL